MNTPTETLVSAMRALANDIQSEDGVANAAIHEAAQRLEEQQDRIKRLEEAVEAYRTAYTPDGHVAPHDCFATGPKTGNPIEDLVACPGCWAERKAKEAKL